MGIKYVELLRDPDDRVYGAIVYYMDGTKQSTLSIVNSYK